MDILYPIQLQKIAQKGYTLYLVGGAVRDIIIGQSPTDYDIVTDAPASFLKEIFAKNECKNSRLSAFKIDTPNHQYEITKMRVDLKYQNGDLVEFIFTNDIVLDLNRRDYTVNAMAINITNLASTKYQDIIDPFAGVADLKSKTLRTIPGSNPHDLFTADPRRILRALRLVSLLNLNIEKNLDAHLQLSESYFKQVIKYNKFFGVELIRNLMQSNNATKWLKLLDQYGLLKIFLPELYQCKFVDQPIYHTKNVFDHTIDLVKLVKPPLKISALFHDVGKVTTDTKDGHFNGHANQSYLIAQKIFDRLMINFDKRQVILNQIKYHMLPFLDGELNCDQNTLLKMINKLGGKDKLIDLIELRICDIKVINDDIGKIARLNKLKERVLDIEIR